ncbi:hypothetical protein DPEC_G00336910 [Dallia pectoralis]|uniref:Uncharacterized protein n=1 Tax=Dallia pectoralis TaxID=75939 RepID=A0ACC2F7B8_DALPE|nr:hypothetical protein DPEC_G00336910 [Dallia pectoralis]
MESFVQRVNTRAHARYQELGLETYPPFIRRQPHVNRQLLKEEDRGPTTLQPPPCPAPPCPALPHTALPSSTTVCTDQAVAVSKHLLKTEVHLCEPTDYLTREQR